MLVAEDDPHIREGTLSVFFFDDEPESADVPFGISPRFFPFMNRRGLNGTNPVATYAE